MQGAYQNNVGHCCGSLADFEGVDVPTSSQRRMHTELFTLPGKRQYRGLLKPRIHIPSGSRYLIMKGLRLKDHV